MLPLFNLLIFSISCCYAANVSSHSDLPGLLLPRGVNSRGNPFLIDGLDGSLSQVFGRATSQDPSCPDGFLCVQQACPDDIICPAGQTCLNFEGTVACGVPGLEICALNPSSFEAVGCSDGMCCHGNCYKSGTVCCNFDSIQCDVGDLCNACSPGQTCGDNQCTGQSTSPPPTSVSTTTTHPPPPPPPPTSISTTTTTAHTSPPPPPPPQTSISTTTTSPPPSTSHSTTTTTTTKTTSPPPSPPPPPTSISTTTTTTTTTTHPLPPPPSTSVSTTSTSAIPTPTLVPSSGTFSNIGCFLDSTIVRVLVVGSSVDQSSTGMTVEKCIAVAQISGLQFAGVEFGGECYVGNTVHNGTAAPQDNCNQVCAGNPAELCGDTNRIQIYQDSAWFDPVADDLANALQQYNQSLTQAQKDIDTYNKDINDLKLAIITQPTGDNLRRRSQTQTIEMQVLTDRTNLQTVRQILAQAEQNNNVLFLRAASDDIVRPEAPLVGSDTLEQIQGAFSDADSSLSATLASAEEDAANIDASTTNLIDFDADVEVADAALDAIGLPAVLGPAGIVATGVFLVVLAVFSLFDHSKPCTPNTATDCQVGCSVTNFDDTSFATNCFTTLCATTVGCSAEGSIVTTDTTTALCPLTTDPGTTWIPASGVQLPFLGNNNIWTTPTQAGAELVAATRSPLAITSPP
ncbi:hypothetical protein B7463_g3468, partial [Scytalidium lignicola]